MAMKKVKLSKKKIISIYISEDILNYILKNVANGKFRSVSHGFEYCVRKLKDNVTYSGLTDGTANSNKHSIL